MPMQIFKTSSYVKSSPFGVQEEEGKKDKRRRRGRRRSERRIGRGGAIEE